MCSFARSIRVFVQRLGFLRNRGREMRQFLGLVSSMKKKFEEKISSSFSSSQAPKPRSKKRRRDRVEVK